MTENRDDASQTHTTATVGESTTSFVSEKMALELVTDGVLTSTTRLKKNYIKNFSRKLTASRSDLKS